MKLKRKAWPFYHKHYVPSVIASLGHLSCCVCLHGGGHNSKRAPSASLLQQRAFCFSGIVFGILAAMELWTCWQPECLWIGCRPFLGLHLSKTSMCFHLKCCRWRTQTGNNSSVQKIPGTPNIEFLIGRKINTYFQEDTWSQKATIFRSPR